MPLFAIHMTVKVKAEDQREAMNFAEELQKGLMEDDESSSENEIYSVVVGTVDRVQ